MGLDRYEDKPSNYDRFAQVFVMNTRRFRITLRDGTVAEGVPSMGSMVHRVPDDTPFIFTTDDGKNYRIPLRDLEDATPI